MSYGDPTCFVGKNRIAKYDFKVSREKSPTQNSPQKKKGTHV